MTRSPDALLDRIVELVGPVPDPLPRPIPDTNDVLAAIDAALAAPRTITRQAA